SHAAQEHAMDRLEERALWRSAPPWRRGSRPGTPVPRRLRPLPPADAPAALLAILPYPVPRRASRPPGAARRRPTPSPLHLPRGPAPALLRCTSAGVGTPQAGSRGANSFDKRRWPFIVDRRPRRIEYFAQFIAVCSSSILAETLGYAVSFSSSAS